MRKDKIFQSFLSHPLLTEKYEIDIEKVKNLKVSDGFNSKNKVVRALAFIVESMEGNTPKSDIQIYKQISQLLNESI